MIDADTLHNELIPLAHRAADAAARITLAAFRQPLQVHDKAVAGSGVVDPVTDADRAAERAIREVLGRGAPHIGFIGEESAADKEAAVDSQATAWIVDPIDGTRAFIAGVPVWGTLIALRDGGQPVFGLLDQPPLRERYAGTPGRATRTHDGTTVELATRHGVELHAAVLCCTTPDMFTTRGLRDAFARLSAQVSIVRYGTDCHGYAMLAGGQVDLVVEADLSPWDVQALMPIVRGAGGVMTDWHGGDPSAGGAVVAAAHPSLHERAVSILGSSGACAGSY